MKSEVHQSMPDGDGFTVVDLRAENSTYLLGTHAVKPMLSWRIEASGRGVMQESYRIRAASTAFDLEQSQNLLWDSGTIVGSDCFDIEYGGGPLVSMQRVWWDVEVKDNQSRVSRSSPTWMEAGLLSSSDWHAQWIGAEDVFAAEDRQANLQWIWSEDPLDPSVHAFRLDFEAPDDLIDVELLVAGKDNLKGVWINGEAARLPETEWQYWGTLIPAKGRFVKGHNSVCIAVIADTEGFFPVDGGAMAALIRLYREGGGVDRIASGTDWKVQQEPPEGWTENEFSCDQWPQAKRSGSNAQGDPRPPEPAMLLRTDFETNKVPVRAMLYATALGVYEARINGSLVSDARLVPEICVANNHVLYQTFDVTRLVCQGLNTVGFIVADGFYAGAFGWRMERYGFGPAPRRLCAQIRIDYDDGSSEWNVTDSSWKIAKSEVVSADIYGGEIRDNRLVKKGWDTPGFDYRNWSPVTVTSGPGVPLIGHTAPLIKPKKDLRAVAVTEPEKGIFVFDFGQNISGVARLKVKGKAGHRVVLKYAELISSDGMADQTNLRIAEATDVFTLAGDSSGEVFEPRFTYHGFRYIQVENYPGVPTADDLEAVLLHSDCRETGELEFSKPLLNRVWQNTLWSQRSNFFGVPTDCPQRDERMGWMGDIQVFFDAAAFNMEVDPFLRRYLVEVRAAQREDGAYPIVVPQPLSYPDVVTAGWSEAGIILPHGIWRRYGNTAVIEENWSAMVRWMDFVGKHNHDFIWRNERGIDLGDWLSVDARAPDEETTPRVLCATAYWAYSAQLMAEMAEATGRDEDAAKYRLTWKSIRDAFIKELVSDEGKAGNGSQTSQVLALYMNLMPEELRFKAARLLAKDVADRGMKLSTGFLGTPYLLDVLADAGELGTVAALLLQTEYPSWGYMPTVGATTIWERWNSDFGDLSMNSYNHYALGAVIGFFYRRLGGIAETAPGFRRIAINPLWFSEIGRVTASYDSCVGTISTQIDGDADGISRLKVTVPSNCIADVYLPAQFDWFEGYDRIRESPATAAIWKGADMIRIEVGSGNYHFTR